MEKQKKIVECSVDEEGNLGIQAISLVEFPAIEVDFVALNKQVKAVQLAESPERRMLYGPVLIPDKLILRINETTSEEYYVRFSAETIRKASQHYMKKHLQSAHTVGHEMAVQGITVVELWLKEGDSDKSVNLGFDLPAGTWFVGTLVDNNEVWDAVKAGTFKGFSVEAFFAHSLASLEFDELLAEVEKILAEASK